jgi:dolichyl-phosphate-mannose--protein O-mannosyl transferase
MLSARLPEGPPLRVQPDRCHTASLLLIFKTSQATEDHFIVSEGILLFFSFLFVFARLRPLSRVSLPLARVCESGIC